VQPSSLIFLVLIAIWAAYLLQHWVSRREHLATARSVDRFSEAMHVLERRTSPHESDVSAPRPRSYTVSPARPTRPEVVVKRAQSPRPDVQTIPDAAVRSTRAFRVLAGLSARRLRGLSLLASMSLALVVSVLVAFSVLPGWNFLVVVAVLVADVAWLRHVAVLELAARSRPPADGSAADGSPRSVEESAASQSEYWPESQSWAAGERAFEASVDSGDEVTEQVERAVEPAVEVDPSGWVPVPVPPPTYTLKAMAPEPVAAPAEVVQPETTECAASGYWSLEGMEYDCELDELVERRSATGA